MSAVHFLKPALTPVSCRHLGILLLGFPSHSQHLVVRQDSSDKIALKVERFFRPEQIWIRRPDRLCEEVLTC